MGTAGSDEELKRMLNASRKQESIIIPIDTCGPKGFTDEEPKESFPVYNPDLEFDKVEHEPCFHFINST